MLTNVVIPNRAGEYYTEFGIDSLDWAKNLDPYHTPQKLKHFLEFPHSIDYRFNSRGFRDHDWPMSRNELQNSIWCIGDSFTVGLGSPFYHIWPQVLSRETQARTINISMDGGSNEWIAMMASMILSEIQPRNMIIMWSYLHRRRHQENSKFIGRQDNLVKGADLLWKEFYNAIKLPEWPQAPSLRDFGQLPEYIRRDFRDIHVNDWLTVSADLSCAVITDELDRRIHTEITQNQDDVENIKYCVDKVVSLKNNTNIVQSIVPKFAPEHYVSTVLELLQQRAPCIEYLDCPLDWARDHHHFDIKTSSWIAQQLKPLIS